MPASRTLRPASWLVSAGRPADAGAPLNPPLVAASNFLAGGARQYARSDATPTWEALEAVVGGLEEAPAVCFSSGMAAVAAVFDQLPPVAHVALPEDCYQGVAKLADAGVARHRWTVERLPSDDVAAWRGAAARADLLWLESPSNPLLTVVDLEAVCAAPRRPGALAVVDNTFATALQQRPLDLGATASLQSATKFIGGHSDLLGGVICTRDEALLAGLRATRALAGATPGALEVFLALRGARTMALRVERAAETALELARRLEAHPAVARVRYPGLPSHPTFETARRVLHGFGSIVSFDPVGDAAFADAVCRRVTLVRHATSLGSVESTMERRAAIDGQRHLPPTLLRLSVGLEDVDDLWVDLCEALEAAHRGA